jgi:hypothetical protein
MVNEVMFFERAIRLLALEADRRAHIAHRAPGPEADPQRIVMVLARIIALPLEQQHKFLECLVIERLPFPADPAFDHNDLVAVGALVDKLEECAAGERERPAALT